MIFTIGYAKIIIRYIGKGRLTMADTFELHSSYKPSGDQPKAIEKLVQGIREGKKASNITRCNRNREDIYYFERH